MFNTILPYRLVQRNRNHTNERESWLTETIYKFFMHSPSSRRKYLVEVREYPNHLYTVDFYAKIKSVYRYRLRTNQHAAGKLGGTVLAIIAEVLRHDPQARFGFIAAAMLYETADESTKRFRLYTRMLELKINPQRFTVITKPENSTIFVLPNAVAASPLHKQQTIARYEDFFRETF